MKMGYVVERFPNDTDADGPVIFGLSVGLSDTQIAEAMLADPQSMFDVEPVERANRKVWPIAIFHNDSDEKSMQFRNYNIPWKEIPEGETVKLWVYNTGSGTLGDTSSILHAQIVWVYDWMED